MVLQGNTEIIDYICIMKQVSNKQAAKLRHYNRIKRELKQELIDKGEWVCFFTGTPLPEEMAFYPHHLRGRREELLVEKDFLVPCVWEYHRMWHDVPISKLRHEAWFDGFLDRLRCKDINGWMQLESKLKELDN